MIDILPGDVRFGARHVEAVGDKTAGIQIEFPHLGRVLATFGKRDEATLLVGREAVRALEHPTLALGLAECVHVEHRRPVRRRGFVVSKARLAPDSAQVIGILPEIIDFAVRESRGRNAILGGRDL